MDTLMQPVQAIGLGLCLIDFEIEEPAYTPVPPDWLAELRQARIILSDLLGVLERMPPRRPEPIDWLALPEVLDVKQAAEALGMYRGSTITRLIREGRIPATKVGGSSRIRRDELRAAIESGQAITHPGKKRKRARPNRQSHPTLGF